jgi:hypothetical protein
VIAAPSRICKAIETDLHKAFDIVSLGAVNYLLGISIQRYSQRITMSQTTYLEEVLRRFNLGHVKTSSIPILRLYQDQKKMKSQKRNILIGALVGCLSHLANSTRPDIIFAVNILSKANHNYSEDHWNLAKYVLKYLKGTIHHGLEFRKSSSDVFKITLYCDAGFAENTPDRKSIGGYLLFLNGNPISFKSKTQTIVAASTCEAEIIATFDGSKQLLWFIKLLNELSLAYGVPKVYCDNQSAISLLSKSTQDNRVKHLDIKYFFIRDNIQKGLLQLDYVQSSSNLADILTKPLPKALFNPIRKNLGVQDISVDLINRSEMDCTLEILQ